MTSLAAVPTVLPSRRGAWPRAARRVTAFGSGLLALALASPACSSASEPSVAPLSSACASLQPTCLRTQTSCVDAASGPVCTPCGSGQAATEQGCERLGGEALHHRFADFTLAPGEEVKDLCQSWTLDNPEEIWVNAVEMTQDAKSHHSVFSFAPNNLFEGPDGVWPCPSRDYFHTTAGLFGGILFAQSVQTLHEVQAFPRGAAIRIPPYSRVVGDVHLLNLDSRPNTGSLSLTLYTLPRKDVVTKLTPSEGVFNQLAVPPRARSRFVTDCAMRTGFQESSGTPVDFDLYYVLPHAHELGRRVFMQVLGGPMDGQLIYDETSYTLDSPHGLRYSPPLHVRGADGLRFGCEYLNDTDVLRTAGPDQGKEMCQVLAYIDSPTAFSAQSYELGAPEKKDGVVELSATCKPVVKPWSHEKAGGQPPTTTSSR